MEGSFSSPSLGLSPAIGSHYDIPYDTHYPLVDGFLQDEVFRHWSAGDKKWQLHCFGAPGCGKTTFAAIVEQNLKARYNGSSTLVTSIFIRDDIPYRNDSFMEDFFSVIDSQIPARKEPHRQSCETSNRPVTTKVNLLRKRVRSKFGISKHSFLILDGYDRLHKTQQTLLDHELVGLKPHNVSVLITRRVPTCYKPAIVEFFCDRPCQCPNALRLYFKCEKCDFALCYPCNSFGRGCREHGASIPLVEPYDHIDLNLSKPSTGSNDNPAFASPLHHFTALELEKEMGDLRLNSVLAGPSAVSSGHRTAALGRSLVKSIIRKSGWNLNLARLRLDEVHDLDSFEGVEKVNDRLPRSITAYFAHEIERIERRDAVERDIGLLAITAVAHSGKATGIPVSELESRIRGVMNESLSVSNSPPWGLDNVMLATNGLLVVQPRTDIVHIACYNQDFGFYVREDYNETLYNSKCKLGLGDQMKEESVGDIRILAGLTASPLMLPGKLDVSPHTKSTTSSTSSADSGYFSDGVYGMSERGIASILEDKTPRIRQNGPKHQSPSGRPCSFCTGTIIESTEMISYHHKSFESVLASLTAKCVFCVEIYAGLDWAQSQKITWPQYCWTTRSTGKMSDNQGAIVVSFRSVKYGDSARQIYHKPKRYYLFPEADYQTKYFQPTLGLSEFTDPSVSGGNQLHKWMKTCVETHKACYKDSRNTFVPTRLVDVNAGPDIVRVVETSVADIKGPYLTLSHSWGKTWFTTLTTGNKHELMGTGIKLSDLSPNFQQAISVARFMGLRYIWIDSLCIIQGPDGDFPYEGQLMHKVYRYSFCNIAIADSENKDGGLFRKRDPHAILPARLEVDGDSTKLRQGAWRILPESFWKSQLLGSKIYTRGWVFQERMLSPRILHFASSQIFWDCCTLSASETLPDGLPHYLDAQASTDRHWRGRIQTASLPNTPPPIGPNDDSIERFWKSSVLNYTSCDLTNQTDKTFAIWSIAKLVRDVLDEEYAVGLWEDALEEQLAWRMKDCGTETRLDVLQAKYPSWTWASVKGPVITYDRLTPERSYVVLDHHNQPISFQIHAQHSNTAIGDDRNFEPQLEQREIQMSGFVSRGLVSLDRGPGPHRLSLPTTRSGAPGHFDVFFDEVVSPENLAPNLCEFMILAASKTNNNARETRYTGIGLLLLHHNAYEQRIRGRFKALLKMIFSRKPEELNSESGPDANLPLSAESVITEAKNLGELVKEVESRGKKIGSELHYYRLGAIQFKDIDAQTWEVIGNAGRTKFWLE